MGVRRAAKGGGGGRDRRRGNHRLPYAPWRDFPLRWGGTPCFACIRREWRKNHRQENRGDIQLHVVREQFHRRERPIRLAVLREIRIPRDDHPERRLDEGGRGCGLPPPRRAMVREHRRVIVHQCGRSTPPPARLVDLAQRAIRRAHMRRGVLRQAQQTGGFHCRA